MRIDRRDRVGLVVALLVAAICVRLGVWQLDRLHERRQRNALLLAARARPPLEIDGSLPADSARDRRLVARGVYDYAHERLWHGRSYEGVPGVDLVTPLRLAGGAAVLVDRGWAPSPDAFHFVARERKIGVPDDWDKAVSFARAVELGEAMHGVLAFPGSYAPPKRAGKYKGGGVGPSPCYSYSACVVELTVDEETGTVDLRDVWIAHDI